MLGLNPVFSGITHANGQSLRPNPTIAHGFQDIYFQGNSNATALAYQYLQLRSLMGTDWVDDIVDGLSDALLDGVHGAISEMEREGLTLPPAVLAKASGNQAVQICAQILEKSGIHRRWRDVLADTYATTFSTDELKAFNHFFSSDMGRSIQKTLELQRKNPRVSFIGEQLDAIESFFNSTAGKSMLREEAKIARNISTLLAKSGIAAEIERDIMPQVFSAVLAL